MFPNSYETSSENPLWFNIKIVIVRVVIYKMLIICKDESPTLTPFAPLIRFVFYFSKKNEVNEESNW